MKKWLAWILALCLLAALMPFGQAAEGYSGEGENEEETEEEGPLTYLDSGFLDRPKMTPLEIQKLLSESPVEMPPDNTIYDMQPAFTVPFLSGRVRASLLQQAADRLSALRNLAGLPEVTLDGSLCERCQYGAVLLGTDGVSFGYDPEQPEGMEKSFFNVAKEALLTSNLSPGVTLLEAPAALMEDSDADNVSTLGHRRFQLYPALKKVGFGYVFNAPNYYHNYTVESVYDYSGTVSDFHFISWPASGYFPADLFTGNTAWSISLNPKEYNIPAQVNITVTLIRDSDGESWVFPGNKIYTPADAGEYMHLDKTSYGVANCIIFRPGDVDFYEGRYTVIINGLTSRKGENVKFAYQVEFFDLASQSEGLTSVTAARFTDTDLNVSATAYMSIPGRYLLAVAAYDQEGKIASINARSVNLDNVRKSYSLMLEHCVNAKRVRAFLLDGNGLPVSLPMERILLP